MTDILTTTLGSKIANVSCGTIPVSGGSTALLSSLMAAADVTLVAGALELEIYSPTTAINVYTSAASTVAFPIPAGGSKVFKAVDSHTKLWVRSSTAGTVTDAVGLFYSIVTV